MLRVYRHHLDIYTQLPVRNNWMVRELGPTADRANVAPADVVDEVRGARMSVSKSIVKIKI